MAAKTTTATYYIVNLGTGAITSGPSHSSQTSIANVLGFNLFFRPNPSDTSTIQAQLEVVVYDTTSNAAIIAQGSQVIPDGYTDFKGFQPRKYIRTRAGDVVDIVVNAGPATNEQDFYVTDASIPFGASGDAVLTGS
jgi:hypothetical protein